MCPLKEGTFNEVTVYSERPYEIAKGFEEAGAQFIHTVDLDGALKGHGVNAETIKRYVQALMFLYRWAVESVLLRTFRRFLISAYTELLSVLRLLRILILLRLPLTDSVLNILL